MPKIVTPLTKKRIENEPAARAARVKELNKIIASLEKADTLTTEQAKTLEKATTERKQKTYVDEATGELVVKRQYVLTDINSLTLDVDHDRASGRTHVWRQWFTIKGARSKKNHEVTWPTLSIEEAREWGAQLVKSVKVDEVNPGEVKRAEHALALQVKADEVENKRLVARGEAPLAPVGTFKRKAELVLALDGKNRKDNTNSQYRMIMERDIYPVIGLLQLTEVKTSHVRQITDAIEARASSNVTSTGNKTVAARARMLLKEVFGKAVDDGDISEDEVPRIDPMRKKETAAGPSTPRPGLTSLADLGLLMASLATVTDPAQYGPRNGLLLSLATAQRSFTVTTMEWTEINADFTLWTIPRHKMKGLLVAQRAKKGAPAMPPHYVPLPRQMRELLMSMKAEQAKQGLQTKWVFAAARMPMDDDIPMGHNAMAELLVSLGWKGRHTQHGCRTSMRSVYIKTYGDRAVLEGGYEGNSLEFDVNLALEFQVDHTHGKKMKEITGGHGTTYFRVTMTEERRLITQRWSGLLQQAYLDTCVVGEAREIEQTPQALRIAA